MTESILDSLVVRVRADSSDLRRQLSDIEQDFQGLEGAAGEMADGLTRVFEDFARSGELSFDSLKRSALSVLDDIANRAIQFGIDSIFGADSASGGDIGGTLGNLLSGFLFGRAGGGAVGAGQPYLVGERGPELFVPQGAGRIMPRQDLTSGASRGAGKSTNITVNITNQGAGGDMTRRSAGQVAVAVRRAMDRADRNM